MAIVGINPVSPRAQPQQQQREKESAFDKVIKGLTAASTAFGIAFDAKKLQGLDQERQLRAQQIEANQQSLAEQTFQQEGVETPASLQAKSLVPVPQGFVARGSEGETIPFGTEVQFGTLEGQAEVTRPQRIISQDLFKELVNLDEQQRGRLLKQKGQAQDGFDKFFVKEIRRERDKGRLGRLQDKMREGHILGAALDTGTSAGDFVAQVQTIRKTAEDVGPALVSELNATAGRLGVEERARGAINKWFSNQALSEQERDVIRYVTAAVSQENRKFLDREERQLARDWHQGFKNTRTEDEIHAMIDSNDLFGALPIPEGFQKARETQKQTQGTGAPTQQRLDLPQEESALENLYKGALDKIQGALK